MKSSRSVRRYIALVAVSCLALLQAPIHAEQGSTDSTVTLQTVLQTHRAWTTAPASIEISGTSVVPGSENGKRATVTEPVRITATSQEKTAFEYGPFRLTKRVITHAGDFRDDGTKVTQYTPTPFSQLDVTSIYLLAHAASTAKGQPATIVDFQGTKAKRITLDRGRTDKTLSSFGLPDKFDIYVSDAGLLLGIARSFDPKNSVNHKESAYAFSDYRSVGGQTGVLLPFQITEYRNNRAFEIITVTEYRFDVLPDSTIFETRRVSPPIPAVQPRKQ